MEQVCCLKYSKPVKYQIFTHFYLFSSLIVFHVGASEPRRSWSRGSWLKTRSSGHRAGSASCLISVTRTWPSARNPRRRPQRRSTHRSPPSSLRARWVDPQHTHTLSNPNPDLWTFHTQNTSFKSVSIFSQFLFIPDWQRTGHWWVLPPRECEEEEEDGGDQGMQLRPFLSYNSAVALITYAQQISTVQ